MLNIRGNGGKMQKSQLIINQKHNFFDQKHKIT